MPIFVITGETKRVLIKKNNVGLDGSEIKSLWHIVVRVLENTIDP